MSVAGDLMRIKDRPNFVSHGTHDSRVSEPDLTQDLDAPVALRVIRKGSRKIVTVAGPAARRATTMAVS